MPAGRLAAGTLGARPVTLELAAGRSGCTSSATPPPMPAETIASGDRAPAVKSTCAGTLLGQRTVDWYPAVRARAAAGRRGTGRRACGSCCCWVA